MRSAEGRVLLADILDAAISATGADYGNIQLVNPLTGALEIVAHKGFQAVFLDYFCATHAGQAACGTAMSERTRVVVEDVETPQCVQAPCAQPLLFDERAGDVGRARIGAFGRWCWRDR